MADLSDSVNWFEIDNSNNKASPNGWPEGMMPSGVNDSARADKGALKRFWDRINPVNQIAPVGNLWTFTTANPAYPTSYIDGEVYNFLAAAQGIGGDLFQVNALGAKPIWKQTTGGWLAVVAGDIGASTSAQLTHNASLNGGSGAFILLNPHVPGLNDGAGGVLFPAGIAAGGAIASTGPLAGLIFTERTNTAVSWLWYADAGIAHLYMGGGHLITVDATGTLHAANSITAGGNVSGAGLFLTAGIYFNGIAFASSDGTTSHIYDGAGGSAIHLQAANNYYDADIHTFRNNSGTVNLLNLDGSGVTLNGPLIHFVGSSGSINTTGGPLIYADNGNHVYKQGSGNGSWLFQNYAGAVVATIGSAGTLGVSSVSVSGASAIFNFNDRDGTSQPWAWYAQGGIARLWNGTNSDRVQVDSGGSATFTGTLSSLGHVTRAGIFGAVSSSHFNIEWRPGAHLWIDNTDMGSLVLDGGGGVATSVVSSTGGFFTTSPTGTPNGFQIYTSGSYSYIKYLPRWYWEFNASADASSGALVWFIDRGGGPTSFWQMHAPNSTCYNNLGPISGVGAYINASDRRGKKNITPSKRGLAEIVKLNPVEFDRISFIDTPREIGFTAQDVISVLPEAVRVLGMKFPDGTGDFDDAEPSLGITCDTITACLVNAVKELHARLSQLETK